MKFCLVTAIGTCLTLGSVAGFAQDSIPDFAWKGDVQIQGDKSWARGWGGDNLDNLWGRLNIGAEYKNQKFSSKFNVRIFPEGFGFEPVIGASYDTAGQGTLKVKTSEQSRVLVNHAWVRQQFSEFAIRVGRFETRQTPSFIFGDYLDLAAGPTFGSRVAVHSATEITSETGGMKSSLILGTNDKRLNKGFLRVYESWENGQGLALSASLRSNLFDKIYDQDIELINRVSGTARYTDPKKWGVFAEIAMIQQLLALDQFPVLVGAFVPAAWVANKISLEIEYLADRKLQGEDMPLMFAVYGQKKVFERATFDVGLYSDPKGKGLEDVATAVRFTCALK